MQEFAITSDFTTAHRRVDIDVHVFVMWQKVNIRHVLNPYIRPPQKKNHILYKVTSNSLHRQGTH